MTAVHDHEIAVPLAAGSPARFEAVEEVVEILQELVRDDICDAHLVVRGLDPTSWDEAEGTITAHGTKRQFFRTALGQPIVTVEYVPDRSRS